MNIDYQIELQIAILYYTVAHDDVDPEVVGRLKPAYFATEVHRNIAKAISDICEKESRSANLLDINEWFFNHGLEHLRSQKSFGQILDDSLYCQIRSPQEFEAAIDKLAKAYQGRKAEHIGYEFVNKAKDPFTTKEDYEDLANQVKLLEVDSATKKLRLEIANYLAETDPFKKVREKQRIQSHFSLSRHDFLYLCRTIEEESQKPPRIRYSRQEFFSLDYSNMQWLVPGLIPLGESILFAGAAKCGKSNLIGDLVHALLSGEDFLGEKTRRSRILYAACDESLRDTQARFRDRAIDLIPGLDDELNFLTALDIENLQPLIQTLEETKPELVVIDNLTTIARNAGIQEKDPEFAHYVYRLNNLAQKYKCTFILLHHENKDPLAIGMNQISGSARILAAPGAIWQIQRTDPKNALDPRRKFKIQPRSGLPRELEIEFNLRHQWGSKGIFKLNHEAGDKDGSAKTHGEMILEILKTGAYEALELKELTGIGRSIYVALERLESRGEIKKRRSKTNPRYWVYSLPNFQQEPVDSQQEKDSTKIPNRSDTPPPLLQSTFC